MHLQSTVLKGNGITRSENWSGSIIDWYALCDVFYSHDISQCFKKGEKNVDSATLERLKTKHTFIVMLVEFFCDSFPTTYLESVLKIFIPKFQGNK